MSQGDLLQPLVGAIEKGPNNESLLMALVYGRTRYERATC